MKWVISLVTSFSHLKLSPLQAAIHWAAKQGKSEVIKWLVSHDADVDIKSVSHHYLSLVDLQEVCYFELNSAIFTLDCGKSVDVFGYCFCSCC